MADQSHEGPPPALPEAMKTLDGRWSTTFTHSQYGPTLPHRRRRGASLKSRVEWGGGSFVEFADFSVV